MLTSQATLFTVKCLTYQFCKVREYKWQYTKTEWILKYVTIIISFFVTH
jgi:hypothetical protein